MRIIKDGLGNVYRDGVLLHERVRIMQADSGRVAVFAGKQRVAPLAVYEPDTVTFDRTGGCATCQGWPPQLVMRRLWEQSERQDAHAS